MQRPRLRVAFVGDAVFNLPGAQPASIYDLLWQLDLTASTFRFTGAMLNPKKAKHTACLPLDKQELSAQSRTVPFALRV